MSIFHGKPVCLPDSPYIVADKSYFCVKDFRQISTFAARPFVTGYPSMVSYIEIPLTSISGHILGSYCVVDNKERDFLHPDSMRMIRETTSAISQYLNMKRAEAGKSRSERMMDGLRHFVGTEQRDSLLGTGASSPSAIPAGPFDLGVFSPASQTDVITHTHSRIESAQSSDVSNSNNIQLVAITHCLQSSTSRSSFTSEASSIEAPDHLPPLTSTTVSTDMLSSTPSECGASTSATLQRQPPTGPTKSHLPTQVGNLFSKAADMIGYAMELDGLIFFDAISTGAQHRGSHQVPSSTNHMPSRPDLYGDDAVAVALSEYRGAEDQLTRQPTQSLIQRLTAKYPQGHVFAVDEYGIFEHGDEHEEEDVTQHIASDSLDQDQWNDLFKCIPKARYVLFLPLWHYQRESCYATCLVWVSDTGKTLDTGDVNSLAAFGNSLMAEIFRLEASTNTQSKSDFVSSISHELRSPLHGIMATIELMQDEVQSTDLLYPMINMIDSCASTLLDTFDHLLEYSSINGRASVAQGAEMIPDDDTTPPHAVLETVDLASIVEDVLETVSLGHDYSSRLVSGLKKERHGSSTEQPIATPPTPVIMTSHIENNRNWELPVEKGAWKRILLNIVSNALKYTKSGFIEVNLSLLEADGDGPSHISFSVSDTGVGMSREFLKHHLFTPFMQENVLTPGTGLGLSLVKSIVESLQGKIYVDSRSGEGTCVTVNIPCSHGLQDSNLPKSYADFRKQDRFRGKTIGLLSLSALRPSDPTSTTRIV
jgi:signal transduction histidine kinase